MGEPTGQRSPPANFGPAVWVAPDRATDPISESARPTGVVANEITEGWPELPEASPIEWQSDEIRMPLPGWSPRDRLAAEQAGSSWSGRRS